MKIPPEITFDASQDDKSLGVKQFECYVDLYDKNVFHFMEEYWSVLHMNNFRASPEHIKFCNDVRSFNLAWLSSRLMFLLYF